MKIIVILTAAITLFAFIFPAAMMLLVPAEGYGAKAPPAPPSPGGDGLIYSGEPSGAKEGEGASPPMPAVGENDSAIMVDVLMGDTVTTLSMGEYLVGVVAAEMPAEFEPDALMAQAAAGRTYILYKMLVSPSQNHPEADACSDPACCKAYASPHELREKWGENYEENIEKVSSAVSETDGQVIVYRSEPILAAFHSSSCGFTENSGSVWPEQLPYLVSVESPEGADVVPDYISVVTVSPADFSETVLSSFPGALLEGSPTGWVGNAEYSPTGRVTAISIGGAILTGAQVRSLFSLRSAAFSVSAGEEGITFTVTGYGHGVGMSQYGANVLAERGKTWREILSWYYPGTRLSSLPELYM